MNFVVLGVNKKNNYFKKKLKKYIAIIFKEKKLGALTKKMQLRLLNKSLKILNYRKVGNLYSF